MDCQLMLHELLLAMLSQRKRPFPEVVPHYDLLSTSEILVR